jgi:G3E family GTPase
MLFCQVEYRSEGKKTETNYFFMKRDVGVQAIEQLLEKRRNHFDYILLETTGVADPLPIVKMFWLDDELHSDLILDGLITVIDAHNGLKVKRKHLYLLLLYV